jgi:hypothetical protein
MISSVRNFVVRILDADRFTIALFQILDIKSNYLPGIVQAERIHEERPFHGKTNPEKFSQRLQDLNRYLDFIPTEKTSDSNKITKAYGKSLPEDEIRSIMGREISPEWTVNLLALGKYPWRFKDLEDQLNIYRQQWQADQQKQIIAQMAGKMPSKSNDGKRKKKDRNHHNSNGGRIITSQGNTGHGGRGRGNKNEHLKKMWNVSIVAKTVTILLTAHSQEKMTMNSQTWFPNRISKTYFNPHCRKCLHYTG